MLAMDIIQKLLILIHILITNLSIAIVTFQGILQLFEDHDSLIILWHAPTYVNLLELWPFFDQIAVHVLCTFIYFFLLLCLLLFVAIFLKLINDS